MIMQHLRGIFWLLGILSSCALAGAEETSLLQIHSLLKPGDSRKQAVSDEFHLDEIVNSRYSILHERPSRIAIASQCGGKFYRCHHGAFTKVFQNHHDYAKKHGYEYVLLEKPLTQRMKVWDRYPLISLLHKRGAEWVLYLDADALFMNTSIDADTFIEQHGKDKDLIAAGDFNMHYQAGVFLMRNSRWAHESMCKAWKICPSPIWNELGAMMIVLGSDNPSDNTTWTDALWKSLGSGVTQPDQLIALDNMTAETKKHLALLPQQTMDSYSPEVSLVYPQANITHVYHRGDWILHFAGVPYKEKGVREAVQFSSFLAEDSEDVSDDSPDDDSEPGPDACKAEVEFPHLRHFDCSDVN